MPGSPPLNVDSVLRFGRWFGWLGGDRSTSTVPERSPLDVAAIHKEHADFVFRALQWLGVRSADLPDVSQEVFVRVHLRLHTFDRSKSIRPWLFGICRKLADHYRRRAYMRRELQTPDMPEETSSEDVSPNPEDCVERLQTRARLERLLDELKPIHRAVLVMREFDGMECHEIAEVLDVPEGTVHSRLSKAREEFKKVLVRNSRGGRQ